MFTTRYRIEGTKRRDGSVVAGFTDWDGLASLHPVSDADGRHVGYLSVLDDVTVFEVV